VLLQDRDHLALVLLLLLTPALLLRGVHWPRGQDHQHLALHTAQHLVLLLLLLLPWGDGQGPAFAAAAEARAAAAAAGACAADLAAPHALQEAPYPDT
jgi:hypothetical protein